MNAKAQTPEAPAPVMRDAANLRNVAWMLWERAAGNLGADDLEWCAGILDPAGRMTRNLVEVVEGIGCLVANDGQADIQTGCFQSADDVPTLLFFVAESMRSIQTMIEIGDYATDRLINRDIYQKPGESTAGE
jgi:hypothetical protein